MPTEMRLIAFSDEEVLEALEVLLKHRGEILPEDAEYSLVHSRDAKGFAVTMLVAQAEDSVHEVCFPHHEALAALLHQAMELEIPMSKELEKKLDIMDGQLVIRMRTGVEEQEGEDEDAAQVA